MTELTDRDIIQRWERAAERAHEERVRVIQIHGTYRATSSSHTFGSYALERGPDGWSCECVANGVHGLPCKHLWALAELLDLDVLQDMRVVHSVDRAPAAA